MNDRSSLARPRPGVAVLMGLALALWVASLFLPIGYGTPEIFGGMELPGMMLLTPLREPGSWRRPSLALASACYLALVFAPPAALWNWRMVVALSVASLWQPLYQVATRGLYSHGGRDGRLSVMVTGILCWLGAALLMLVAGLLLGPLRRSDTTPPS